MDDLTALLSEAGVAILAALNADQDERTAEACRRSLHRFVVEFWDVVEPGRLFVDGPHLHWLCAELEAITDGETMRALFNVPPGAMKEVHVDEPVMTRRGRIRLGDVIVGDEILTHRGRYRTVEAVHDKGQQQTLLVTTETGRQVRAELSHPFLTTRGWIGAQDLRLGDVLAAVTPIDDLASDMSAEEARFLGYIVGDGGVTHSPQFTNTDEDVLADFEECASALGMTTKRRTISPSLVGRSQRTSVGISGSLKLLERHGLLGKDSYTKRIPEQVLRSSNEAIANFLGAYWSCDGTIHIRHKKARGGKRIAVCTTVGKTLAGDIQHALLRLGISTRVRARSRPMETESQPGGTYYFYNVLTQSHEETAKFTRLRGLCPRKERELKQLTPQSFEQGPLHEDAIVSIEAAGLGECRCLTVAEDHSFTANDIAVHNSLLVSVFWPAWEWGPRSLPHMRYLLAAYTQDLTLRDNRRCKAIIQSDKYQRLWPDVQIDPRRTSDENFANTRTGWRIATSPGGLGTGERADRIIIDDPHSVKTADSDTVRNETLRWWREVIPTRVNDAQTSAMVVIMQRVHEDDVSGDILDNRDPWSEDHPQGFVHVCIPMRYESGRHCVTARGEDWRSEDGELYWPERFPEWTVLRDEKPLGRFGVAAQFQQLPAPRSGGIIMDEQWQVWPPEDEEDEWYSKAFDESRKQTVLMLLWPPAEFTVAYLDTAFTEKEENAYCACVVFRVFADKAGRPRVCMTSAWRDRPTLRQLGLHVLNICRKQGVDTLVIENRAGAEWAKQELQRQMDSGEFSIVLDEPRGDKTARLHAVSPLFEDGVIFAPKRAWADMVIKEVAQFPKSKFKDLTDCVSGGLGYLRRSGLIKLAVEHDEDERETRTWKGNRETVAARYGV